MNWEKERSNVNYCGYCIDYTCVCDGTCFKDNYNNYKENRKSHLHKELIRSESRLQQIKQELVNYESI